MSMVRGRTCLILESEFYRRCGFISTYLYMSVFRHFGGTKERFEVCSSKIIDTPMVKWRQTSLLLKLAAGQRTGSKHLTSLSGMLQLSAATTSAVLQLCSKT